MKKSLSTFLVAVFLLNAIPFNRAQAVTSTNEQAKIEQLQQLIAQLTVLVNKLAATKVVSTQMSQVKPNLRVSQVSYEFDIISGNSLSVPVPDQNLEIVVTNDSVGSTNLSATMFEYTATVYEKVSGSDPKVGESKGVILMPAGGQRTVFNAAINGGAIYNGEDMERTFYVVVTVDPRNKIKEANERDNRMEASDWITEYYKG